MAQASQSPRHVPGGFPFARSRDDQQGRGAVTTTPHLITEGLWESISRITAHGLVRIHVYNIHTLSAQEWSRMYKSHIRYRPHVHPYILPTCLAPNTNARPPSPDLHRVIFDTRDSYMIHNNPKLHTRPARVAPRVGEGVAALHLFMSTHGKWEMASVSEWEHGMILSTAKHGAGGRTDGRDTNARDVCGVGLGSWARVSYN